MVHLQHFPAGSTLPESIHRFRYQVYVLERGLTDLPGVDHRRGIFSSPDDSSSHFQIAFEGDQIVGLVRGAYARDLSDDHELVQLFGMGSRTDEYRLYGSISTQLMVAHAYRNTSVGARLVLALYQQSTSDGVRWDFLDCSPGKERFFSRFGYRRHLGQIHRAGIGQVVSMILPAMDYQHLSESKSLFARYCPTRPQTRSLPPTAQPPTGTGSCPAVHDSHSLTGPRMRGPVGGPCLEGKAMLRVSRTSGRGGEFAVEVEGA